MRRHLCSSPAPQGSKLRDSLGQFTGGAGADRAEMLELMDGAYIVDDRKGGSGKGAKDSKEGDDAGDEAVEQEKASLLKTQSFVACFNIAGLVHSHRVLEWVRSDKAKTDGFQERIPTAHCTGKAMQLPDRATLIKTAEERESKGELWVLLVLIRIFSDEYLYKGRSESSLAYGLIELGEEAYVVFQAYYDQVGATIDELSAVAEGGGDIAVSSKSRGKALLNAALIALARICMSAYSNAAINAAFKSKLATDPAGMTYAFMHATVGSFFTETINSAPDEHHCRLINKGDIEGAIILAKYGVAQHQLASNRWIKVPKVAGSAAAMESQLEAASPSKLPASSSPKETEKKKKADAGITAADMVTNLTARHGLYTLLNPLPSVHAAAIVQAIVNVLRQEKSEPFVLSCSYASQINAGRVGLGEPTKPMPRGGKLTLGSKSPMLPTMRGGVLDCFAELHLAKVEEEEVSSEQATFHGIGSRKKSRFYLVFLNIEKLIAASATPEMDRKAYDCMLGLFKLNTLVYHQLMTTHLIDFANVPLRLASSEADARGKYGRVSALPTPEPAAAEALAPQEALPPWEEEDEMTAAVRAAAIDKAAGELDLGELDLVSLADQLAEAQAQGLAEAGAAAAMPPPPPQLQGSTAAKRGRSANASASSSPAVTAPKRPTSMFGNWVSNTFGLSSTPAQSPAAGVPLPPPLPSAGATLVLPPSAAGAASD